MKPRIYPKKAGFSAVLAGVLRVLVILAILALALFFLLRSWTVYDDSGAHIRFPWAQSARAEE